MSGSRPTWPSRIPSSLPGLVQGRIFVMIRFDSKESLVSSSPTLVSFLAAPAGEAVSGAEMFVKHFVKVTIVMEADMEKFAGLCKVMKDILDKKVEKVVVSSRHVNMER